ncbi:MAG: hypothetical protein RL065_1760 [Bacteroidota bacterium]
MRKIKFELKSISIQTTQHVKIDYELASWADRALAFVVDGFVLAIFSWLMFLVFSGATYVHYFVTLPVFLFLNLINEIFNNGQSWGKKMMGIKIVKLNSSTLKTSDYAIRWCFRCLDIYGSLGLLASLFVGSSKNNQRLGDMLASTVVIRLNPKIKLSLADLLRIQTISDYEPLYNQVTRLSEKDVLTIKNVLDDFKEYKNNAHAKLVDECTEKIMLIMGITEHQQEKNLEFLRIVLKDYVVLTR